MADRLVNAELLRGQANSFRSFANDLTNRISDTQNAIDTLTTAVHGDASAACFNQWDTAKAAMLTYVPKLNDVADRLEAAANTNMNLDTGLSGSLKVEVTNR
ncbi:MAG: WXG100 family type VII secretion target [Butyrivibrio sp.]|nr:WXG100 family type VII secretion target [Butyrivibrio sp.]